MVNKLEWSERFSCHTCNAGMVTLNVNWSSTQKTHPGFEVVINGQRLKRSYPTLEEAKTVAVKTACKWLRESLERLEDNEP